MAAAASSSSFQPTFLWTATALASLPAALWFRDSLFGFSRVHGTSMEPTLKDGDMILVRKADRGVLVESLVSLVGGRKKSTDPNKNNTAAHPAATDADTERAQLLRSEVNRGLLRYSPVAKWYERPPAALTGHVVVYESPRTAFPTEMAVKRVVGLGGQYVVVRQQQQHHSRQLQQSRIVSVPDYSLYVQGDNAANSVDSRHAHHGAVSKNLLVGVAEYIVWPPSRWQRIQRNPVTDAKGQPISYWL